MDMLLMEVIALPAQPLVKIVQVLLLLVPPALLETTNLEHLNVKLVLFGFLTAQIV